MSDDIQGDDKMNKIMSMRIDSKIKEKASRYLHQLGLTSSQATRLFLYNVVLHKGLPFELRIPNKTTTKAVKESENNKNLIESSNVKDMFHKLEL